MKGYLQHAVVAQLHIHGHLTSRDLVSHTDCLHMSVRSALLRLQQDGLVARTETLGQARVFSLTPAGTAMAVLKQSQAPIQTPKPKGKP